MGIDQQTTDHNLRTDRAAFMVIFGIVVMLALGYLSVTVCCVSP